MVSVIAHELAESRPELQIPPFISIGGGSEGPGFLGMAWAPFSVNANGDVRNLNMGMDPGRLTRRMQALSLLESGFIKENRGIAASEHAKVLDKTLSLMTSKQMAAFKVNGEPGTSSGKIRPQQFWPRLPDGQTSGRSGRSVCRSQPRRLG